MLQHLDDISEFRENCQCDYPTLSNVRFLQSQEGVQGKIIASLNQKFEGYASGVTWHFAGFGNVVQVLKYFDGAKEKEEQRVGGRV